MKVKFTQEVADFIKDHSFQVTLSNGDTYCYMPFYWKFESLESPAAEQTTFDRLPYDVQHEIRKNRGQ